MVTSDLRIRKSTIDQEAASLAIEWYIDSSQSDGE